MRKLNAALVSFLALACLSSAAAGGVEGQNKKVEGEIKSLERQWLIEPYKTGDMSAYDRIVADEFTITHSNGEVLDKAQKRADILASRNPDPSPSSVFKIDDASVSVRVFGNVAISVGHIIEQYPFQGRQVNDQVHFTNTYLKRRGRWQVVACQLTRVHVQ